MYKVPIPITPMCTYSRYGDVPFFAFMTELTYMSMPTIQPILISYVIVLFFIQNTPTAVIVTTTYEIINTHYK